MTAKTLLRLERAAMRWWRNRRHNLLCGCKECVAAIKLYNACIAHAQRKSTKRKVK